VLEAEIRVTVADEPSLDLVPSSTGSAPIAHDNADVPGLTLHLTLSTLTDTTMRAPASGVPRKLRTWLGDGHTRADKSAGFAHACGPNLDRICGCSRRCHGSP
jgi:hypothetical protein